MRKDSNRLVDEQTPLIAKIVPSNMFDLVPKDVVNFMLSFLSLRDVANLAQVNRRFHGIADNHIPMKIDINPQTREATKVPFMVTEKDNKACNYSFVRQHLILLRKKEKELSKRNNNFVDKNVFKHDERRTNKIVGMAGLLAFCPVTPLLIYGVHEDSIGAEIAGGVMTAVTVVLIAASIYLRNRTEINNLRISELKDEIGDSLKVARNENGGNDNNEMSPVKFQEEMRRPRQM